MSKFLNALTAAIVITAGTVGFADDEDLFSDVPTTSVFEDADANDKKPSITQRVTNSEALRDLLKAAGFEVKVAGSRVVTLEKKIDPWTFPALLVISEDEKQISIMLGLRSIKDVSKELPAPTLLKMMTASQENAPVLFSYHTVRERTEVSQVIKNENITGLMLRDTINTMAILAKKTAAVWASTDQLKSASEETSTPVASNPTTPIAPAPTVAASTKLVGKWSAARSATEAFAVEMTSTGTFNLVYINSGKQTKSSGKFTATATTLSLVGTDGLKLEGRLNIKSDTQFSFSPANGKLLEFTKAK